MIFVMMQTIFLIKSNHESLGGKDMPPPYGPFLENLSFLALDVVQWLPVNCAYKDGFTAWHALLMVTLSPIIIFLAVFIATSTGAVSRTNGGSGGALARKDSWTELKNIKPSPMKKAMGYFMAALLLILPTISRRICQSFRCHHFGTPKAGDESQLLEIDLDIDCASDQYRLMLIYALAMVLVYPIGVWFLLYFWLRSFRARLDPGGAVEEEVMRGRHKDEVLRNAPITALALKFTPRYWWYECLTLARRLMLTSAALMFQELSHMTIFVLFVSILNLIFCKECLPYERRWMSAFAYVMDWQVIFFIQGMLMMDAGIVSGAGATAMSAILLFTNLITIVVVIVIQRGDAKRLLREGQGQSIDTSGGSSLNRLGSRNLTSRLPAASARQFFDSFMGGGLSI